MKNTNRGRRSRGAV